MADGIYVGSVYATFKLDEGNVTRSVGNIGSSLQSVGNSFTSVGQKFTLGVSTPIAAGLGISSKLFGDFDKTIRLAGVTMGATGQQADQLRELAKRMGQETSFSASDAAGALLELAKGGMTVAQIQGGALAETLKLASAGGLELSSAAQYVVKGLNMFGLEAKDAGRITTALAGGANASTASVDDLGLALSQVGPGVQLLGYNIEDTVAVLAEFANVGIRGSDAGTSLKTMLQRLSPQTKEAAEAMKDLGLNFFNAQGKALPLRDIAQLLQDKLKGLTDEQKQNALTTIFGADAYRAAAVLADGGAAAVDKYSKATRDSKAASDLAKAATEGQAGAIERAKGSLETAAITVGEKLAPNVIKMAGSLEKAANAFGNLPGPIQQAILNASLFLVALGPIITVVGNVLTAVAGAQRAFAILSTAFTAIAGNARVISFLVSLGLRLYAIADAVAPAIAVITRFGTVIFTVVRTVAVAIAGVVAGASALAIAVAVAVALVVAGLIYVAFHFNQVKEAVGNMVSSVSNTLQQWGSNIAGFFTPIIESITNVFSSVGDKIGAALSTAGGAISNAFSAVAGVVASVVGAVLTPIIAVAQAVGTGFAAAFSVIYTVVSTVFTGIASLWNGILYPILSLIGTIIIGIGTVVNTVFTAIGTIIFTVVSTIVQIIGVILYGSFLFLWNNVLLPTIGIVTTVFSAIGSFIASSISTIATIITTVFSAIWSFIQVVFTGISTAIQTALNFVYGIVVSIFSAVLAFTMSVLQTIFNTVSSIFNAIYATVSSILSAVFGFVSATFNNILNAIRGPVQAAYNTVVSIFNAIYGAVAGIVGSVYNAVASGFNNVANAIANGIRAGYNAVVSFIGSFSSAGREIINGIVAGISSGAGAVVSKIKEICSGALNAVKSFFGIKSPSRVMRSMGDYLMQGFTQGIEKTGEKAVAAVQSVNADVLSAAQNSGFFDQVVGGITTSAAAILPTKPALADAVAVAGTPGSQGAFNLYGDMNFRNPLNSDQLIDSLQRRDFLEERGLTTYEPRQ